MNTKPIVVAVSGGFDPLHVGHLRMFEQAKSLGNWLVVILNNDNWLRDKKGYVFMPEQERMEVILGLECVDEVIITDHSKDDADRSVTRALAQVKPNIFANGGDRRGEHDIPEAAICKELGIEMVFNTGGDKVQSSSWLTQDFPRYEDRPWGHMVTFRHARGYWVKALHVNPNARLSLQSHSRRSETWVCAKGVIFAEINGVTHTLEQGKSVSFGPNVKHRVIGGEDGGIFVEVAYGDEMSEKDITRYQDDYGRV